MVESSAAMYQDGEKKPSVKGALSDLHHAVSDKISAWNPYATKNGKEIPANASASNYFNDTLAKTPLGEYIADGVPDNERLGARTRIGKCTILFNMKSNSDSYWERAVRTHEVHDQLHGYRLHVLRQQILDDVWSKPAYILSLLLRELAKPESERLDWLLWFDADTVILNPNVPIETFLPPAGKEFEDVYLLFSNDWNGLNNGVFPIRVNQWAVKLFSNIVAYRHYKPEEPLPFRDQSVMDNVMHEPEFVRNIVQLPQRWFNAYQGEHNETLAPFQIRRGDLLLHFAGVPNREERMMYWLDRAEQHLDDWEVPLKSTSYPQERKDFWAEYRVTLAAQKKEVTGTRLKATQLLNTVETQLVEFGDRLSAADKEEIKKAREDFQKVMSDDNYKDDKAKLEEELVKMERIARPLTLAIKNSQKILLNTAHEAIFGGEKDLLDGDFASRPSDLNMQDLQNAIERLKMLVMAPQSEWHKPTIVAATDSLTAARAKLKDAKPEQAPAHVAVKEPGANVVVVTSIGPATTVMQVQTVVGEAIVATVTGEAVIQTVTQNAVAVTLWTTVEEGAPEATQLAEVPKVADLLEEEEKKEEGSEGEKSSEEAIKTEEKKDGRRKRYLGVLG